MRDRDRPTDRHKARTSGQDPGQETGGREGRLRETGE